MTMNSEITLEINGYKRNILGYGYQFFRNTDRKGRPVTGLLGGNIYVEMESDGSSDVLEMMLADMDKPRPCFFSRTEPVPVRGKIRHTVDDMMFRELAFDEAYIYYYGETMEATGCNPMLTRFLISPTRLDINRIVRMDRRISTTYGFGWEEYKEEQIVKFIKPSDNVSIIIDAFWIDKSGKKCREFPIEQPVKLHIQLADYTVGDYLKFDFEDEASEGIYHASVFGTVDKDGFVIIENFELKKK